jgi:hypothetical protein
MVKKLVTIFAGNLDSFIMINNHFKHLFSTATSGSGQINVQMTLIQFAGTCKNCAIPSLHRDSFPGLTGQVPGRLLRRVMFPNYIAVPLAARQIFCNIMTSNAQARVWQPIPATIPSLPNTCFFATSRP